MALLGCTATARIVSPPRSGEQTTEPRKLHQIFELYFEEYLQLFPTFATFIGDHGYDDKLSIAIQPILQIPDYFTQREKIRLSQAYSTAITSHIAPAYRKLGEFIRDEYLPQTRASVALSDLPKGDAWYDHLVRSQTTTDLTPDEIFQLGLSEIERINKERERMRVESKFAGTMREFAAHLAKNAPAGYRTREALVRAYEQIRDRVTPQLSKLFGRLPKARYEIRTVEEFRERSAPSQYWAPSPDGSRPGIFYVNASGIEVNPRRPSESLFIHEAVPGHHFQISLQREQAGLPRFRHFGGYTAFVEGWALYAESLGPELGLYADPHQYFSRLNSELFRVVRLVVDVGLTARVGAENRRSGL